MGGERQGWQVTWQGPRYSLLSSRRAEVYSSKRHLPCLFRTRRLTGCQTYRSALTASELGGDLQADVKGNGVIQPFPPSFNNTSGWPNSPGTERLTSAVDKSTRTGVPTDVSCSSALLAALRDDAATLLSVLGGSLGVYLYCTINSGSTLRGWMIRYSS